MNCLSLLLRLPLSLLLLSACTPIQTPSNAERTPIPGGSYSWGTSQKLEDSVNLDIAQSRLLMYSDHTSPWKEIIPSKIAAARVSGLQSYPPMQARWKLKDGREFVLNSVDQGAIVREYMQSHELKVQWQREKRRYAPGDADAKLTHDIKDDTFRLKWVITINQTPVDKRLRPDGAANPWTYEDEEHVIAVIKGTAASGIDFTQRWETSK